MTKGEITQAVKAGVHEAIGDLFVDREQHYDDHKFVKGVRSGIGTARKGSLYTLGCVVIGAIIWSIKSWVASIGQ